MVFDYLVADRKTKTRTLTDFLGGEERLEDTRAICLFNSAAGVVDRNRDPIRCFIVLGGDIDLAAGRHTVGGVGRQIQNHLRNFVFVDMLTPGRRCENGKPVPVNDPEWIKFTNELAEAGKAAYKASQSRNQEAVSDISNQVSESCQNCHQVYRDKRRPGGNLLDPSGKANRCTK